MRSDTALAVFTTVLVDITKESGTKALDMAKDWSSSKTRTATKVSITKAKLTEKETINGKMERSMLVIGWKDSDMAKANGKEFQAIRMKEIGLMVKHMAMAYMFGKMVSVSFLNKLIIVFINYI